MPSDFRRRLERRAALEGLTVSEFLLRDRDRDTVSFAELSERIRKRGRLRFTKSSADVIRELRGEIG
jgi:hypothetical protein